MWFIFNILNILWCTFNVLWYIFNILLCIFNIFWCIFYNLVMYFRQKCDVYSISCDVYSKYSDVYSKMLWCMCNDCIMNLEVMFTLVRSYFLCGIKGVSVIPHDIHVFIYLKYVKYNNCLICLCVTFFLIKFVNSKKVLKCKGHVWLTHLKGYWKCPSNKFPQLSLAPSSTYTFYDVSIFPTHSCMYIRMNNIK